MIQFLVRRVDFRHGETPLIHRKTETEQMKTLTAILAAALLGGAAAALAHEQHERAAGPGIFGQPPEYVHVLLNPLPVYGVAIGILALGVALLARSRPAQAIALGVIVVSSASAWLVVHYGQNAYAGIREKADEAGQQWLDEHMERGEKFVYVFYATALLGLAALITQKKFPKAALPLTIATLVASGVSLGIAGWISKAGGQIRHPEFRGESVPSTNGPSHEHGAPKPSHETMKHDKAQPSDAASAHKHGAMPEKAAEKTPVPDTLEGVWKTLHEHHGELEAAVNGKKFSAVQSHAEDVGALAKRLVDLSHPDHKPAIESAVNKVNHALDEMKQSAETGSELVMKNNFAEFAKALNELEQQMKKQ